MRSMVSAARLRKESPRTNRAAAVVAVSVAVTAVKAAVGKAVTVVKVNETSHK